MDPLISELWKIMINYGYETRIKGKDGLERWNYVKKLFPDIKINWIDSSRKIYDDLTKLGVIEEESGLSHEEWERHHYLLQHGRIIHNNPNGSFARLMQIAYNIGQFRAEQEKKNYPIKQLVYYRTNKLDHITTYINNKYKLPEDMVDILVQNIKLAKN